MTYNGPVHVFTCDYCGKTASVARGLPAGWIWVKTGGPVKHACVSCCHKVPIDKQRSAGQLN